MIVNGRAVTPQTGDSVLEAARAAGVTIPTLYHHSALPPDHSASQPQTAVASDSVATRMHFCRAVGTDKGVRR